MYGGKVQNALSNAQILMNLKRSLQTAGAGLKDISLTEVTVDRASYKPARPVGFSNVILTSVESHLQWLQ